MDKETSMVPDIAGKDIGLDPQEKPSLGKVALSSDLGGEQPAQPMDEMPKKRPPLRGLPII
jgi:hypothetical protein